MYTSLIQVLYFFQQTIFALHHHYFSKLNTMKFNPLTRIVYIQRILLFTSTSPSHCIGLSTVSDPFRETIIDFDTFSMILNRTSRALVRSTVGFRLLFRKLYLAAVEKELFLWVLKPLFNFIKSISVDPFKIGFLSAFIKSHVSTTKFSVYECS